MALLGEISEARKERSEIRCSFCSLHAREVKTLIAGPVVFICNECVKVCVAMCAEADKQADEGKS